MAPFDYLYLKELVEFRSGTEPGRLSIYPHIPRRPFLYSHRPWFILAFYIVILVKCFIGFVGVIYWPPSGLFYFKNLGELFSGTESCSLSLYPHIPRRPFFYCQ